MEPALLAAIAADPDDVHARQVYADWLEDRGDRRAAYLRTELALREVTPDHPARWDREQAHGRARLGLDPAWLARFESAPQKYCQCFEGDAAPVLHGEVQDTESDAWKQVCDTIEDAAARGETELDFRGAQLITLPRSIGKVVTLRSLNLYGSRIARLPRELGLLPELTKLTPYTSYNLHWFPYELARAPQLRGSTISTRALYGNYKHRSPFPQLAAHATALPPRPCSVCDAMFDDLGTHRYWLTLRVASDVAPMLVNACSRACVDALPPAAPDYVEKPHRGGPGVHQPKPRY